MENNSTYIVFAVLLGFVGIGFIFYSLRFFSAKELAARIQNFAIETNTSRDAYGNIAAPSYENSLFERTVILWVQRTGIFLSRYTPRHIVNEANRKLNVAGNPLNFRASEYLAMRAILLIGGILLGIFLGNLYPESSRAISFFSLFFSYLFPISWLERKYKNAQKEVQLALPDALDMLSVSASAGLGFDQAMQKVAVHWDTTLGIEFAKVLSEMEVGISRQNALKNLAHRIQLSELSTFITLIIQSENLGMSIADTLHAQAEQMRLLRRYRAQEIAQKLPAKMLIPVAFFILPSLIAVIIGPSISSIINIF